MKIKSFILIVFMIAGLCISAFSAFMTFVIINEPIGMKMFTKIVLTIISVLPIIVLISYYFGDYLSKKFLFIQERLKKIEQEDFASCETKNTIQEISQINESINMLSAQMDTLINDLKQKNQNLSNLLISMAHDVKTPITILNGYLEEMQDGLIDKRNFPLILQNMKQEVNYLNELTVDMLGFISSMQTKRKKENIDLYDFVKYEIVPLLPSKKNVNFVNGVDKELMIEFNKMDLKKIFVNILTNAYRHTNHGGVKVISKNRAILFKNSGEEIKDEYKEKVFEPFFTISKSKNRKESGFGLGLSIVKNLSENNGYICYIKESNVTETSFILEEMKL